MSTEFFRNSQGFWLEFWWPAALISNNSEELQGFRSEFWNSYEILQGFQSEFSSRITWPWNCYITGCGDSVAARSANGQWAFKFKWCVKKKFQCCTTLKKKFQCCTTLKKKSNVVQHWKKNSNVSFKKMLWTTSGAVSIFGPMSSQLNQKLTTDCSEIYVNCTYFVQKLSSGAIC